VPLKVNKVTSTKTQIPYEYYDIPFCLPPKKRGEMENLGEVLAGDAITNSPYQLEMKVPKACVKLCAKTYSEKDMKMFRELIDEEYRVHWLLDALPAAVSALPRFLPSSLPPPSLLLLPPAPSSPPTLTLPPSPPPPPLRFGIQISSAADSRLGL